MITSILRPKKIIIIIIITIIIIIIILIIITRRNHNFLGYADIPTDRELSANKPDIVIKDHADKCCKLIDVSVPANRNTSTKVIEKLSKYKDLKIEIARMWGMRTETVPVIVGALGLIREGMDQNLEKIPGTSNINELQKIVLLARNGAHTEKVSVHQIKKAPGTSIRTKDWPRFKETERSN